MKTKAQKQEDVELLKNEFANSNHAFVVQYQGIAVEKDWELRKQAREANFNYRVVKNTLAQIAVEGTPLESLKDQFIGPTAIAYNENDPVTIAKVLSKFAKENPKFTFKAGVVEGRAIAVNEIEAVASMPSKEELISKIMFLINSGAQRMAVALNGVSRNLAVVMSEIAKQKSA
ncbi:MAG TPA: 50S ribosomal protein L10 [Blastocatellia bacterium]|nr:50S ribosomal protein L10 [Blastocatellia bacterium]